MDKDAIEHASFPEAEKHTEFDDNEVFRTDGEVNFRTVGWP